MLSILQAIGAITAVSIGGAADQLIGSLTIAAAIQNFIICIEMFFAAIALRYAFPYNIYREKQKDKGLFLLFLHLFCEVICLLFSFLIFFL